jgi:glucuronate isomerase
MTDLAEQERADAEPLVLDPDRLFPEGEASRQIARELYAEVAGAPIISPHGHVDPHLLLDDAPFPDPAELLLRHDHYVTRLLHASGVSYDEVLADGASPRLAWRRLCEHWDAFQGTASGYWLRHELGELFGITMELSAEVADQTYDAISARLEDPGFRPRALFSRFGIEVLATTDDPLDDLAVHDDIAASAGLPGRVIPTFRPDAYLDPTSPGFAERAERLTSVVGGGADDFSAFLDALRARRAHFIAHGAVSADHGVQSMRTLDLPHDEAAALYRRAVAGEATPEESAAFTAHMLTEMAGMSVEDGLVMTVHPGVLRGHDRRTLQTFGPDTGHDIPVSTEYTESLRPLLNRHGNAKDFHLVLFTVDETSFSREIAPLAGYYPSVFVGAPWWFLDAPDAVLRFRSAVTETAGFTRGSGFIDDTRAFLSIPARHDMSRRLDAAFLARLVAEGRVPLPAARRLIVRMTRHQPREVFKL